LHIWAADAAICGVAIRLDVDSVDAERIVLEYAIKSFIAGRPESFAGSKNPASLEDEGSETSIAAFERRPRKQGGDERR
jgi:hypothetical protein